MLSMCSYVLDGIPRTFAEAASLFTVRDAALDFTVEEPEEVEESPTLDTAVLPSAVILLDGPHEILEKRVGCVGVPCADCGALLSLTVVVIGWGLPSRLRCGSVQPCV